MKLYFKLDVFYHYSFKKLLNRFLIFLLNQKFTESLCEKRLAQRPILTKRSLKNQSHKIETKRAIQ
jgi:hypothetical protein